MIETCMDCGKTWGVTMTPRTKVRCTPCARPRPDREPVWYWQARIWNDNGWSRLRPRSAAWWDNVTTLEDLEYAVECAEKLEASHPSPDYQNEPEGEPTHG